MRFPKSYGPRQLNIREMWRLYRTLSPAMSGDVCTYFIDEVIRIMKGISNDNYVDALGIMFGWDSVNGKLSPLELSAMFSSGVRNSGILSFREFVDKLRK